MTAEKTIDNSGKTVCVTGASGFIGTHVVRELLGRGYKVRATVRDAENSEKTAHLKKIAEDAGCELELFSANLLDEGSFDEAFAGSDYICHIAASVKLTAKDPQKEIVDPALLGATNALRSAVKAGSVKRFVMTSSIAAIFNIEPRPEHVYSEADWCEDSSLKESPYPLAKTLSEKAAWGFMEDHKPDFDLICIHPAYVIGPVYTKGHIRSSPTLLRDLLIGTFPLCPRFNFGVVDVRDVADAHVNALEHPDAKGRYMLNDASMSVKEMADALRSAFPNNKKIPKRMMPNVIMYAVALFDKRLNWAFLRRNLGVSSKFDGSKCTRELGITYRNKEQAIVDTCQSMLDHKLVKL